MRILFLLLLSLPSFATNYTWSSGSTNILVTPSTFIFDLQAGDSVFIPFRSGGYRSQSFTNLDSKDLNGLIVIKWIDSAYITPAAFSLGPANILNSCKGLKIHGMIMNNHVDPLWRIAGGYSSRIKIDSCSFIGSGAISNIYNATLTAFGNNKNNSMWGWEVTNCIFDGSFGSTSGARAVSTGRVATDGYWFDMEVHHNVFKNYSSSESAAIYVSLDNCWNCSVHDNVFENMGVVALPKGHASVINTAAGFIHVYNNFFKGNFGNAVRGQFGDFPGMGEAYTGRSRIYNNIMINSRKYPFLEPREIAGGTLSALPGTRSRSPEMWFNTIWNSGVGTGSDTGPYHSGGMDAYQTDSATVKGNAIAGVHDAAWGSANAPQILWIITSVAIKDTSNNALYQYWSQTGLQDSVTYTPGSTSPLLNTGPTAPAWLTTDFYGNPRSVGQPDIGAVERQLALPLGRYRKAKRVRWVAQ